MAKSVEPYTFKNGFKQPATESPWLISEDERMINDTSSYTPPSSEEVSTSNIINALGDHVLRTWPTIYDGTASPSALPSWWKPSDEVDVLICGGNEFSLYCSFGLILDKHWI
jgi:phenol 2-monooxygenase (NADPH)